MRNRILFAVVLALCGLLPFPVLAVDQKLIKERTDQLQKMSEIERERLNRNIQEFQKLKPEEKQHYRAMHAELFEDRVHVGGLSALLQTYSVWVQTLPPKQRIELQNETVPAKKLALVHQFKEEQDRREAPAEPKDIPMEDPPPPPGSAFGPRISLSLRELNGVMQILVDRLPADLVKPDYASPRLVDYLPIIHASVQSSGGNYRNWPDDAFIPQIIGVLGKESTQVVSKAKSKRESLVSLILLGVMKQVRDSVRLPSETEKLEIFEKLPDVDRQKLMKQYKENMNWILTQKYFESKGDDSFVAYKKIGEYRRQIEDLFLRCDVVPPPRFQRGKFAGDRPRPKG